MQSIAIGQFEFWVLVAIIPVLICALGFFLPVTILLICGFVTSAFGVAMMLALPVMMKSPQMSYLGPMIGAYSALAGLTFVGSGLVLAALAGGIWSIRRRIAQTMDQGAHAVMTDYRRY